MTAQAQLIEETVRGMKRVLTRTDYDSESDQSINQPTNRGNKLKRKARYVQEGQLDRPNGPRVYKRKIEHAGYSRSILSRNPPHLDVNGYEIDEEDEDNEYEDADETPYSDVKLEFLLAPLTSAAGLANHPTLSVPYSSKVLTDMTLQSCDMVRKEKASLARTKQLLTKFRGDENWMPCGALEGDDDVALFRLAPLEHLYRLPEIQAMEAHKLSLTEGGLQRRREPTTSANDPQHDGGGSLAGNPPAEKNKAYRIDISAEQKAHSSQNGAALVNGPKDADCSNGTNGDVKSDTRITSHLPIEGVTSTRFGDVVEGTMEQVESPSGEQPTKEIISESDQGVDVASVGLRDVDTTAIPSDESKELPQAEDSVPAPHRMTTRAQAQAASDNTASAETVPSSRASSASPIIHPIFKVPASAQPDRDLGLPFSEAEETRRLLLLYVQKQEEICRGAEKLNNGLLQADRMRRTVMKWAKAEAHVGEMSDGEDWYDKDEWGLDEDLRKGHEEEEDDGNNHGKKTRGRRA
ncbi:MAG: hypothetical protein M1835_005224 [Candelina submexicana]|nr:MAG: hypothetical protein M1835_005224 [Candelina submexicana]